MSCGMETNPHDNLFKTAFTDVANVRAELLAVLPPSVAARLSLDEIRLESASFVGGGRSARHADLAFSLPIDGNDTAFVYVVFEHKSTNDPWVAFQLLGYMVELWTRFRTE